MKMLWVSIPNFVIGNTPLPTGPLLRQLRLQCRRCHLPKILESPKIPNSSRAVSRWDSHLN